MGKEMKKIFDGKTILITGGTGYLGRSLTRELLNYKIKQIRILSRDEVKHHNMQEEFNHNPKIKNMVGDVRDFERVDEAVNGVDIVIHAAAMKRIDMVEYNVMEAVKTNVYGTKNVVRASLNRGVEKVVFVSTDKACSPINSYGATKMLGEKIIIESNYNKENQKTIFTAVRYGNVLDSTGSVIPFFLKRIADGKSIPITDNRMTRFIISANQAINLIFDALKHGKGGELFVPKIDSMAIPDLAELLKEELNSKSKIEEVGIRVGEKIHEELLNEEESRRAFYLDGTILVLPTLGSGKKAPAGSKPFSAERYSSEDSLIGKEKLKSILKKEKII